MDFYDGDIEMAMLDDEYRFRKFLRDNQLDSREARQNFKNDLHTD
jgi:hypothetical protein